MEQTIRFSVVTVCFNAASTIEKTMDSVLRQSYPAYEFIIMDGGSADATTALIERYLERVRAESGNPDGTLETAVRFTSEPDRGLYHAMNKAIGQCSGDYIIFMNSGDTFFDERSLENSAETIAKEDRQADIYYGDVLRLYTEGKVLEQYPGKHAVMKLLLMGRMPCHQSMFVKTDIMKHYGFDEDYRITADYNFLVKCKKNGCSMQHLPLTVSISECEEGISSRKENLDRMRAEDDRSLRAYYPVWYWILRPIKFLKRKLTG